ncbi:hypothetical protein RRG08_048730, partial [Elysia crispata]
PHAPPPTAPLTPAIHILHLLHPSHTCHPYPPPPTALSHLPPIPSTSYTPLTPATHTLHLLHPSHTCHPHAPPPTPLSHLPPTRSTSYSPPTTLWLTERTNLTVPRILFTTDAKLGWIGHLAPLTGVILDIILIIMVVASRPFVRRSGYFQTFYWTHKLYVPYYILTFIHAPNFWKWLVVPVAIFLAETFVTYIRSRGGSTITRVSLLPSAVTQLVIKKPPGFKFKPGDYVYIKIPAIAKY